MRLLAVTLVMLAACGDGAAGDPDGAADDDAGAGDDADADDDADAHVASATLTPIFDDHRYVPGAMFGGWGPHLGHLVELGAGETRALHWIDDHCDQAVAGDCNVNVDRRLAVLRKDGAAWTAVRTVALPGTVQQNTATIADGATAWTFGIDSGARRVIECRHDATSACAAIPIDTGPMANYVGAAITPAGWRVVWWTNVVDGGGGSFSFLVDYGGGWNGPRTGAIAGYNDCAYAHVAFAPTGDGATFFCQVVSGLAPNWTFSTLVGAARLAIDAPVTWTNALAPPSGDTVMTTSDLWIDPSTGDAHLLARSTAGTSLYYHRPAGGAFGAVALSLPATFRARWLITPSTVALVSGPDAGNASVRTAARTATVAGQPLALVARLDVTVAGGLIQAIYPTAPVYQRAAPVAQTAVVVTADRQFEAVALDLDW